MALEKRWEAIPLILFSANGTVDGIVTIPKTRGFHVKQEVYLQSNTQDTILLEVKRVLSKTQFIVGPKKTNLATTQDISAYLTSDSAGIYAVEQSRPSIPLQEHERAVFEEEPVVAKRTFLVDTLGKTYDVDNPFPVQLSDGSVNIGTVNAELEVQLSAKDNYPHAGDVHDSVRLGDGVSEAKIDPLNLSLSTNRYEKLLGLLANANWMNLADFDAINPSFTGNVATLEYLQNGAVIGKGIFTFVTDSNWSISLERYINDTDGSQLLDDDGTFLNLD